MSNFNVDYIQSQAVKQLDLLDAQLNKNDYVRLVKKQLPPAVRPSYVVIGVAVLLFGVVYYAVGGRFVSNLVGYLYPLYESYRALAASKASATGQSESQWLTYWIVYGFFTLVESATDLLLYWIPFYYLLKIVFLVWLMAPNTKGASVIYENVIAPVLNKYESNIDAAGARVQRTAQRVAGDVLDVTKDQISPSAQTNETATQPGEGE